MRTVDVLHTEGDATALKQGVAPGDPVVVDGVDNLQPGTKVAASQPGAPSGGAPAGGPGGGANGGDARKRDR
jgi:hypothetical protein